MIKGKPRYPLGTVKALLAKGSVRVSYSALASAARFGLNFTALVAIVVRLTPNDYQKNMATYRDSSIFQDVYFPIVGGSEFYLALVIMDELLYIIGGR